MRPTFAKMVFEMETRFQLGTVRGDPEILLPLPVLYTPGMSFAPGCFYILNSADLSAQTEGCRALCLICLGAPPPGLDLDVAALLVVDTASTPQLVYNSVREVFQQLLEWDESLRCILEHNGGIQELLDASAPVFGNMLIMNDEDNNRLAASSLGHQRKADELQNGFNDAAKYDKLALSLRRLGHACYTVDLREAWELDEAFVAMFLSVLDNQKLIGTLALLPFCRPIGEHDSPLLAHLAGTVKEAYLRTFQAKDKRAMESFTRLLTGVSVSEEEARLLREVCRQEEKDHLRCLVIELPAQITESHYIVLRQHFHEIVPNAASTVYEDRFVVLVNGSKSGLSKECLRGWLNAWLGSGVRAGVSDGFTELTALRAFYLEAVAAFGFTGGNKGEIMEFEQCRLAYVLANCPGNLPVTCLFPAGLRSLLELNQTAAVDYIETLRVWLEEGLNDNRSAQRLFVRRNSFLYRRDRMLETLGMDLHNPDVRFYLGLCLRLLEHA